MNQTNRRSFLSNCAFGAIGAAGAFGSVARGAIYGRGLGFPSAYAEVHNIVIPELPTLAVREVSVPGPVRGFDSVTVEAVASSRFSVTATASAPTTASLFCQANAHSEFRTPNRPNGITYGHVDTGAAAITYGGNNTSISLDLQGVANRSGIFRFNGAGPGYNQYFRDNYLVNGRFPFLFVAWSDFRVGTPSPWTLTVKRAWVVSTLTVTYNYTPLLAP